MNKKAAFGCLAEDPPGVQRGGASLIFAWEGGNKISIWFVAGRSLGNYSIRRACEPLSPTKHGAFPVRRVR